ncbi:MAG: methyltransferase domain-containing protein [Nitrospiraceae bacterium]|nr:methyltransferase domain-containing protein [Nitrospiraceae bacterium]
MQDVVDQFSKRAETYSTSAHWISDSTLIQAHLDVCERVPPGNVLELCCGTGMVGRNFRAAGWSVIGVDLTRDMAVEANRYFPCIRSSADNLPFLEQAFDIIVLRQAYFLLVDGQRVLSEARRVLKDDGVFVLSQTVPYSSDDAAWLEKIHRTKQAQLKHFYTENDLTAELNQAGFEIAGVRRLSVRENITRWMEAAPELSEAKRAEVCGLVADAPEPYRSIHQVEVRSGEIFENWSWVVFSARKRQ